MEIGGTLIRRRRDRSKAAGIISTKYMYAPWLKSNVAHLGVLGKVVVVRSVLAGAALLSRGEARRHVQGHVRGGEVDGSSWWEHDLE